MLDLQTAITSSIHPAATTGTQGGAAANAKGSIYSLACSANASVVAAGTTESAIRIIDPRSGQKVAKLLGHDDNIRALAMNADGTLLLSGSSDHTIR